MAGIAIAVIVASLLLITKALPGAGKASRALDSQGRTTATTAAATTTVPPTTTPTTAAPPIPPSWQVGWGSAMAWGYGYVQNATVRSLALLPVNGEAVRVRISNEFGTTPLAIGAATVGESAGGASVYNTTLAPLHFSGATATTVPPGSVAWSDPVAMTVTPNETLAVSVYIEGLNVITAHYPCCEPKTPSYVSAAGTGNLTAEPVPGRFGFQAPYSRFVDAVVVERPAEPAGTNVAKGSIVVVGDSITDGWNSTARWPSVLQERVNTLPVPERPAIINEGITANALTPVIPSDATKGGGPPGVQRLAIDALDLPGVSTVVLFLGTNDLFFGASAQSVIAGIQQAVSAAHAAGAKIVGVTLLPRLGSEGWNPARQAELAQVNQWLLSTNQLDGVINLATPVADMYNGACNPTALLPAYDSNDHLHPNAAGDIAMADAINPQLLGLPALPAVPPAVAVRPTVGCQGAPGIPAAG